MTTIGQHVYSAATWNPAKATGAGTFDYIDLSGVDQNLKTVTTSSRVRTHDAPSRARQLVKSGDVLVSTVRPNLNSVAIVPDHLDGATASTGFTVLRPKPTLDGRYLFHWVRSPEFVSDMVRKATGASYPAVSDRVVKETAIPLPPLAEQRRIAAILDQADMLRAKRRQTLTLLDDLIESVFESMSGALVAAPRLSLRALGCDFTAGRNLVATGQEAHSHNRVIKVSAVSRGTFDPSEAKELPASYDPPESHRIRRGDILFGRASGSLDLLGATAVVDQEPGPLFLPDKVWRLELQPDSRLTPEYAMGILRSGNFREYVRHHASGAAGVRNIGKATVLAYVTRVPSIEWQQLFSARVRQVVQWRANVLEQLATLEELTSALQTRAFTGNL